MAATEFKLLGELKEGLEQELAELGPRYTPWRDRLGLRPKPKYLKFLTLDQFIWNRASLTPRLRQLVEYLCRHVKLSWQTLQPIAYVRLIGHTDNTGPEKYNRDLGNRRAQAVKEALEGLLKDDILKRRIAILVESSPGASAPSADNRTALGRALNRRVEVFVTPPEPPPEPKKPIDWTVRDPGPGKTRPISPVPRGRSFRDWFNDEMAKHGIPKFLRTQIWDAIFNKNWGLLSNLLNAAGFSGGIKDAIIESARAASQGKAR